MHVSGLYVRSILFTACPSFGLEDQTKSYQRQGSNSKTQTTQRLSTTRSNNLDIQTKRPSATMFHEPGLTFKSRLQADHHHHHHHHHHRIMAQQSLQKQLWQKPAGIVSKTSRGFGADTCSCCLCSCWARCCSSWTSISACPPSHHHMVIMKVIMLMIVIMIVNMFIIGFMFMVVVKMDIEIVI
eukprot:2054446-Rhodomonas_salina.2